MLLALMVAVIHPRTASAQLIKVPARKAPADTSPDTTRAAAVAPDSPRAALTTYLDLSNQGRYADASAYLDVPDSLRGRSTELARELKVVLDHYLWIDLDEVSGSSAGDTTDGLSRNVEQIGTIRAGGVERQPIRLVRLARDGGERWVFSRSTVARVPAWYGALPDRWTLEHLPAPLRRAGPLDILWWQWLAIPLLLAIAWMLGVAIGRVVRALLVRLARRTSSTWDDELVSRLAGPIALAFALIVAVALLPLLALNAFAHVWVRKLVQAGFTVALFWALWRLVDVWRSVISSASWVGRAPTSRSLLVLGSRVLKVAVGALGVVVVLAALGYPVAALLGGLGLGGLALALAAQKTVENLFGAFAIGADRIFHEGDYVKVDDFAGTVERIGLRSTRIRTLDRTIITLPNAKLADSRIESFAVRDRIRLSCVLGLVYDTTAAQMRDILAGIERVLREHPKIWPDSITVRFVELAASSLDIQVMAWFQTADWNEFQLIRQEMLLAFIEIVERAGSSFAFPTQSLRIESVPSAPPGEPPVEETARPR